MLLFLAAGVAVVGGPTLRAADMAVVPRPAEIKVRSGSFTHNAHTVIGELRSRIVPQLARLDPMKAAYYVDSPAAPAAAKPAQQGQAAGKARTTPPPPPQVIGLSCHASRGAAGNRVGRCGIAAAIARNRLSRRQRAPPAAGRQGPGHVEARALWKIRSALWKGNMN